MTTPALPRGGFTCEETYPRLYEFLDGVLPEPEAEKVAAHLRLCEGCGPWMQQLEGLRRALAAAGEEVAPGGLWERLQSRLADAPAAEELPGTWPVPETEAERIRRLSRFSTRRVSTRNDAEVAAATIAPEDRAACRESFPWPFPEDVLPETPVQPVALNGVALPSAAQLARQAESAKVIRTRIQYFYAAGIAAMLLLGLLVGQLMRPTGPVERGDPGIVAEKNYVEALLAVNFQTYRKLEDSSVTGVEHFVARNVSWSPVVFPDLGAYVSADVWRADQKDVACAVMDMEGATVAVMCSPWKAGEPVSGAEALPAVRVDEYEFRYAHAGDRHLVLWTHTWNGEQMLYSLLYAGEISQEALQDLALTTLLEIEQRAREQSGKLPG